MRALIAAALLVVGAAGQAAQAAAPNDIIWDPPKTAAKDQTAPSAAPAGQPDKNGIIWDTPAPSGAKSDMAESNTAKSDTSQPDANGIVWNTPPKATIPGGAGPAPRVAQAPVADGPCREFQTTIVIDGRQEPAHGTVCRQPDGTWRLVNK